MRKYQLMSHNDLNAKPVAETFTAARWLRHISEMMRLAPVIVLARSGVILIVLVDTVMVGHFAAVELGYLAMGLSLVQPLVVASLGLIMGTMVLTAHHFGAGEFRQCGWVWRRSMVYAAGLGTIGAFASLFGETFLTWTGQTPELAREGGRVMFVLGMGLPGHLVFLACSFFLEGVRRPTPGFVAMAAANLINLVLNWLFIYGYVDGVPEGAMGASLATSIARWSAAAMMLSYVWFMRAGDQFAIREPAPGGWRAWSHQRRLGYATGVSLGVESTAFTAMQQFAGWLGAVPLAAFTATFYLLVVSFMVAIGFGGATAVRVGIARGRGDSLDMALAGWTGLGLTLFFTAVLGFLMVGFDSEIIAVFTNDANVAAIAIPAVFWVAVALMSDGGQAVIANALRGRQDVWMACYIQTFVFFGIMVPLSWFLMFPMGQGVAGAFQGVWIATMVAVVLLSWRFHRLYRRDQALDD
jgi:multidrug resistance protein, MATE family